MINKIIEGCLKNRVLVIAAFLLIVIYGISAMRSTPIDAIPDVIPLLGWLFKSQTTNQSNNELLIFITPTILDR